MLSAIRRNPLTAILLGALVLRIAAAVVVQHRLEHVWKRDFVIAGDAAGYWELGRRLADGEEYSLYDPPRRVHRMPGFPALLAVSMTFFGSNQLPARLLLAVVGTLACGMVYLLGREVFGESAGLIAAGYTAIAPVMIGFSVLILSETLFALCLLGSLYLLARLVKVTTPESLIARRSERPDRGAISDSGLSRRAIGLSLAAGAMIAVATYVRPSWLLAVPFAATAVVLLADNKKQGIIRASLLALAAFAALLPWAYRNHRVTDHWVFTTLWAGPSLYDGLNPEATGDSDMRFFDRDRMDLEMSEYEVDQHYRKLARNYAANHPGHAVQLALAKAVRYWKPWPNTDLFNNLAYRLAVALFFLPLMLFALRGWWVHRRDVWAWLLTVGPVIYFFALHLVFVSSLRYRLPAEYPLCVMAAAGFESWFSCKVNHSKQAVTRTSQITT